MKFALLIALILCHLCGPDPAEAPMVTEVQDLRMRVKGLEALELWAIRCGWKGDLEGRVWR